MERHPATVRENQMGDSLPRRTGTAKNPQTSWRRNGPGAPPPRPVPPRLRTPPAPPDDSERSPSSEKERVPPGYLYIPTPLTSAPVLNLDPYANDRIRDKDYIPDLLTDEGPSTI